MLLRDGRLVALVDLDDLSPADPTADLASWVADELALRPELDLAAAASPLLEGYGALTPADLAPATARALVERAAAGVRRLQEGALEQAAAYLATAREVLR